MPIVRQPKTGGRQTDQVIAAYAERYELTRKQKVLLRKNMVQIALADTEEVRKLLLGVSA